MSRLDPFDTVFGALADEVFPPIRREVERQPVDVVNRDAFLMLGPVGAALRRLVSDAAPPEALDEHAALLHHAYRYWAAGRPRFAVGAATLERALQAGADDAPGPSVAYVELPERKVWAAVAADRPPEPLEGYFVARPNDDRVDLLAVFGLHPARGALSVVTVEGPWEESVLAREAVRTDGSAPFSSLLPGGEAAALLSLRTNAELLLLARRVAPHLARGSGPN